MLSRLWQNLIKLPLQWVLVIPFVVQTTSIVGVVGWLFIKNSEQATEDLARQLSRKITLSVEEKFQSLANTPYTFLGINQLMVENNLLDLTDFEQLEKLFWQQIQLKETVDSLYVADKTGRFLMVKAGETDSVHIRDKDQRRLIYGLDDQGQRTHLLDSVQYDPRQRPWYQTALKKGIATWSPVYLFASEPVLGITSAVPIYANRKLQGVLAIDLSLNQVSKMLRGFTLSPNGIALIVEPSGAIVASSLDEPLYVETKVGRKLLYGLESQHPIIRQTLENLQSTYGSLGQIMEDTHLTAEINGQSYFVEVKKLEDGYGLNWLMVVALPAADFMTPLYNGMRTTVLLGLLVLVVSAGISLFIAQRISRPIVRLQIAADAMAQGKLQQKITVNSVAEVNGLALAFNFMAQTLKQSFHTLEQMNQTLEVRVEERTTELQQQVEREKVLTQQLAAANQELQNLANIDGLTQVANRRKFNDTLHQLWFETQAMRQSLTLILCDIDFFKRYNDTYGHPAGDNCLQQVGQILHQTVARALSNYGNVSFLVARYGGEEFALLLSNTLPGYAHEIAKEVQANLAEVAIPHETSALPHGRVSLSMGMAHQFPSPYLSPLTLLKRADQALYQAKEQGRDRIILIAPARAKSVSEKLF
ncbi:MAG: diguanylate cyclase [Leptolyngbyaceae cyanobacterium MAG.088]|nr:diguanylate cyclase [Leptolyngbyaceae cyanobacterium MAG.088]